MEFNRKGYMENNYIKEAMHVGVEHGLDLALQLAKLQRDSGKDIDYLITSLLELIIKEKQTE